MSVLGAKRSLDGETVFQPNTGVDLSKYIETRYVQKNRDLQRIFSDLEKGNVNQTKLQEIEPLIRSNNWSKFNFYCIRNGGINNFWETLQCLFFLRYFADDKIDFDQMQKAMGIQQMRWTFDRQNEFNNRLQQHRLNDGAEIKSIGFIFEKIGAFTYFQEIDKNNQKSIATKFLTMILRKSEDEVKDEEIQRFSPSLNGRIFYKVPEISEQLDESFLFGGVNGQYYLGIPQTYNFNEFTCFHVPILVFGSLSPMSLVNFILRENKRAYAAHLPGSKSNLEQFDGDFGHILCNWRHDFEHQLRGRNCRVQDTIIQAKSLCDKFGDVPDENSKPQAWLENKAFQKCIDEEPDHTNNFNDPASTKTGESFTDLGSIFEKYERKEPFLKGGKKSRKNKRKPKSKNRKSRRGASKQRV